MILTIGQGKKKYGFTLLELLAVIAIIGVLTSIILPTIGVVQRKAKSSKAETMIQSMSIAAKMFESDYGYAPLPAGFGGATHGKLLYDALGVRHPSSPAGDVGPYIEFKSKDLATSGNSYMVIDPWGTQYYYYGDDDGGVTGDAPWHNVFSFDMFSLGPDKTTSGNAGSGGSTEGTADDDINNWD